MPLPPPPRYVRANGPDGLRFARLVLIPVALLGLGLLAWLPVHLWVEYFGHPITATVDRLTIRRGGRNSSNATYNVGFHFVLNGRRWDDAQLLTAAEFAARHVGEQLAGRAIILAGFPIALTAAGNVNRQTGGWAVATVIWNVFFGSFTWGAFVTPWRTRRLLRKGTATTGEVVASGRPGAGQMRGYQTRYRFTAAGGRTVESTATTNGRRPPPVPLDPGSPVTIIYDPARPTRSLAIPLSGYRVGDHE